METYQKVLIGLIVLAIVAVVVGNGKATTLIGAAGNFLVSMTQKVTGSGT